MQQAILVAAAFAAAPPLLPAQADWQREAPLEVRRTGVFKTPGLTESSGVVVSRTQAGVLWTLNDSDHPAWLFAIDTLGSDLGTYKVQDAKNRDWEALAAGSCGDHPCLYVGDTGDNNERHDSVAIYRVWEPSVGGTPHASRQATARPERIEFTYPDGPHDVEAMYLDDTGDLFLITKGWRGSVLLFRVRAGAWKYGVAEVESLGTLPIMADRKRGRLVTDAAISPDGRLVVVRTYADLFFFHRAADGRLDPGGTPTACGIEGVGSQGEGVDWIDGETLVLTSEASRRAPGTILLVRCRLP